MLGQLSPGTASPPPTPVRAAAPAPSVAQLCTPPVQPANTEQEPWGFDTSDPSPRPRYQRPRENHGRSLIFFLGLVVAAFLFLGLVLLVVGRLAFVHDKDEQMVGKFRAEAEAKIIQEEQRKEDEIKQKIEALGGIYVSLSIIKADRSDHDGDGHELKKKLRKLQDAWGIDAVPPWVRASSERVQWQWFYDNLVDQCRVCVDLQRARGLAWTERAANRDGEYIWVLQKRKDWKENGQKRGWRVDY